VTTESLIEAGTRHVKRPLPSRRRLLTLLALWSMIALLSASDMGLCIGRALWHAPFNGSDPQNWTPVFILLASVFNGLTQLHLILGGSYQGGEADRNRLESIGPVGTQKSF
jgi:hypothetical protein